MSIDPLLVCPKCSSNLRSTSVSCTQCGFDGEIRSSIPSFVSQNKTDTKGWLNPAELNRFATITEDQSLSNATSKVLDNHKFESELLSDIYDVRREDWRVLVSKHLQGRCLDLSAGYGRRAHLLAEIVDEVYAVDHNLQKLRVLNAREDYQNTDNIFPVHSNTNQLPVPNNSFDTVVADLTGHADQLIRTTIQEARRSLSEKGSLILLADGWPRRSGSLRILGADPRSSTAPHEAWRATPGQYRSLLRANGFKDIRNISLFPTDRVLRYAFDSNNSMAVRNLSQTLDSESSTIRQISSKLFKLSDRLGLVKRCYPSYLFVAQQSRLSNYSNDLQFTNPLLVSGRARAVVLELTDSGVERVSKIPNRAAHVPLTNNESHVLDTLISTGEPITETLPDGRTVSSRFGPVRKESPASGSPLGEHMDGSVESVDEILQIGFDWLIEFQQSFRSDHFRYDPAKILDDLTVEQFNLKPPKLDKPIKLFNTPVHGDFLPQNIFVNDGSVSTVIDWEYGAIEGNPIVDAGFFVLKTVAAYAGGVTAAIDEIFEPNSDLSTVIWRHVNRYCETLEISRDIFEAYLPYAYIRRITNDSYNNVTDYQVELTIERWESYLHHMWKQIPIFREK